MRVPGGISAFLATVGLAVFPPASRAQERATVSEAEWFEPGPADPSASRGAQHPLRALGEITFVNLGGLTSYFAREGANRVDWEYQPTLGDQKARILSGWSFDTNTFGVNFLGHTYSGAFYYQVGRSNGFSPHASAAFAFGGSLMWEYVGEFREPVSANDMIFTTVGGTIVGELFRQTSLAIERASMRRFVQAPLAFVFDPFRKINEWWDRKNAPATRRRPVLAARPGETDG